jgi:hypothetical protein
MPISLTPSNNERTVVRVRTGRRKQERKRREGKREDE